VHVLLAIARESGIRTALSLESFADARARRDLETATADAIARGAFGVPGFWIPGANDGRGRFFWGQDRMHFVEATLLAGREWRSVPTLQALMPHCVPARSSPLPVKTRLEFWFDFSSPWAFLGYTQLARLQREFPGLEVVLKPFLLGILFREIGAPNMPMLAASKAKAAWSRQDHEDWVKWWNAVNVQGGGKDKAIAFHWADVFPIRTPTVLRVGIVEPAAVGLLCEFGLVWEKVERVLTLPDSACWEQNANVSDDVVLAKVLTEGGYDGPGLVAKANAPAVKTKLRECTAEAKEMGICGVPTYRVLREDGPGKWKCVGGLVWGQDETNVVEDLIAGWDPETSDTVAEPRKAESGAMKVGARL
jgi:2-hydroxychromene-2-carboxylate isomerase